MSDSAHTDLVGRSFGRLTILSLQRPGKGKLYAVCACSCAAGRTKSVRIDHLMTGKIRSCGCIVAHNRDTKYTGQRFGRLVMVSFIERKTTDVYWSAVCDCGNVVRVCVSNVRTGHTRSCGCLRQELASQPKTHGMTGSPTYNVWAAMIARCNNSTDELYGARGIRVCQQWTRFEQFFADMGERPSAKHSIDRFPDNNGNYEPGNCRWATAKQQANNRRSSHRVEFNGTVATIAEWETLCGIPQDVIERRLNLLGWPPKRALTEPVRGVSRADH